MESRIELGGSRTFSIENVLVPPTPILLGLEVTSEEQTNLTVLEGRFDWRQIVGVRNMLFGAIWC